MRESPALDVLELLGKRGAELSFTDPFVPCVTHNGLPLQSVPFERAVREPYDCAVICTDHSVFDYDEMVSQVPLIVDSRNALKDYDRPTIFRL
jgi:UDP-N-acetyl-D-glucosamine dehydrogenase